jgi:hypothetical protein
MLIIIIKLTRKWKKKENKFDYVPSFKFEGELAGISRHIFNYRLRGRNAGETQ